MAKKGLKEAQMTRIDDLDSNPSYLSSPIYTPPFHVICVPFYCIVMLLFLSLVLNPFINENLNSVFNLIVLFLISLILGLLLISFLFSLLFLFTICLFKFSITFQLIHLLLFEV